MGKHIEPGTRLFVSEGCAILIGGILDTKVHAHHAIQLTLGPYGEFGAELEGTEFSTSSLLVDSDFPHRISGGSGRQLLALFEPESRRGALLRRALDGSPFASAGLRAEGEASLKLLCEDGSLSLELASSVFSALGLREDPPAEIDPRVTFFDSAHFSRAFSETFGLSPAEIFKDSGSVQVRSDRRR